MYNDVCSRSQTGGYIEWELVHHMSSQEEVQDCTSYVLVHDIRRACCWLHTIFLQPSHKHNAFAKARSWGYNIKTLDDEAGEQICYYFFIFKLYPGQSLCIPGVVGIYPSTIGGLNERTGVTSLSA